MFHIAVTVSQFSLKAPGKVNQLFEAFTLRLNAFENILSLVDGINILAGELSTSALEEIKLLFLCIISILRINTVMNHEREKTATARGGGVAGGTPGERRTGFLLAVIPIPEEHFEKFLRFLHIFLVKNLSNDLKKGSSMVLTSSSSSSSTSRGTDSPPPSTTIVASTMISPSKGGTTGASIIKQETKTLLDNSATKRFLSFLVSSSLCFAVFFVLFCLLPFFSFLLLLYLET
jgi:hypothetical protein